MNDISHKQITLRTATAEGMVLCSAETIERIKNNSLPKGNLFDVAKVAGMLAAKKTPELIPHCHPLVIDGLDISFKYIPDDISPDYMNISNHTHGIFIEVHAKCIARTGIEIEAMTAVSVAALTIVDLLKPIDKNTEISGIKLRKKVGGKTQYSQNLPIGLTASVLVCSDSVSKKEKEDKSGQSLRTIAQKNGLSVEHYTVVPDDIEDIQKQVLEWVKQDIHFIFITGGTGLSHRDNTITAIEPLLEKKAPGIAEAMRNHGTMRTPYAMFSQSIAGTIKNTLIVCMPGSTNGVKESCDAIFPHILHIRKLLESNNCIHNQNDICK